VLVPVGAGVGSAIGFLRAPVGYEVVRSLYQRFSSFDVAAVNALLADMAREAEQIVAPGSFGAPVAQTRFAYMRYVGQGHEIAVALPPRTLTEEDVPMIRAAYDAEYTRFYNRPVPGSDVEVLSYAVNVATVTGEVPADLPVHTAYSATPARRQAVRDTANGEVADWPVYERASLAPGATLRGPAIIAEDETSTLVGPNWTARITAQSYIEMTRENA